MSKQNLMTFMMAFLATLILAGFLGLSVFLLTRSNPAAPAPTATRLPTLQFYYTITPVRIPWAILPSPSSTTTPLPEEDKTPVGYVLDGIDSTPAAAWVDLPAVHLQLQMPHGWQITETTGPDYCQLGHELADYDLTGPAGDDLKIHVEIGRAHV